MCSPDPVQTRSSMPSMIRSALWMLAATSLSVRALPEVRRTDHQRRERTASRRRLALAAHLLTSDCPKPWREKIYSVRMNVKAKSVEKANVLFG